MLDFCRLNPTNLPSLYAINMFEKYVSSNMEEKKRDIENIT